MSRQSSRQQGLHVPKETKWQRGCSEHSKTAKLQMVGNRGSRYRLSVSLERVSVQVSLSVLDPDGIA